MWFRSVCLALMSLMLSAAPVLAQETARVERQPLEQASISRWIVIVLALLLVALVMIPCFKDSKRSEQQ